MARPCDRRRVNLHGHQNRRLISDCARPVPAPAIGGCDAALILAEGQIARTHLGARSIHRLDPPPAGQRNDPLRRRVFVPLPNPADRLDRKDRGRFAARLVVVPLRIGGTDAFQFESGQLATLLVADAFLVAPEMPIAGRGA
jgi:hypothetical protein